MKIVKYLYKIGNIIKALTVKADCQLVFQVSTIKAQIFIVFIILLEIFKGTIRVAFYDRTMKIILILKLYRSNIYN